MVRWALGGNKGSSNASNRAFNSKGSSNASNRAFNNKGSSNASNKDFSNRDNKGSNRGSKGFNRGSKGFNRGSKGFNRGNKGSKISRVSKARAFCFSITPILKVFLESSPITPHFQG